MVAAESPLQGVLQCWDLPPKLAPGQLCESVGIPAAGHQRQEHVPTGLAQDVRRHRRQLDPGVLQDLVEALDLPSPLLCLGSAVAREVAKLPDRLGRHKARPHQPVLHQLGDPLRVLHVGLASGHVAHVAGVE